MKFDNSPARGMRDLLPSTVAVRDRVLAQISEVYHRYGYQRIETPALEDIIHLQGGEGGDNEKLIFQVLRRGLSERIEAGISLADLTDLGLRFDLTVPLARFYGRNHAALPQPFRSFQFGPVWRAERPQKGRYRQFYQCDIDLIAEENVLAEVELIEATTEALDAVGLPGTTVRLSDRRFLSALAAHVGLSEETWATFFIGLDKLDKVGWEGVRAELIKERALPISAVEKALSIIRSLQGVSANKVADRLSDAVPNLADHVITDLTTVIRCLERLAKRRALRWEFDPTLVRGMGYYTGQIFEVSHPASSSSVAGGGRYDKLIGQSLGRDVPACGFSIGFERIVDLLDETPRCLAVAILFDDDVEIADVLATARRIRAEGKTVAAIRRSGKLGAQLRRLEEWEYASFAYLRSNQDVTEVEERPLHNWSDR